MKYWKSLFGMGCIMTALLAGCTSSSGPGSSGGVFADAPVAGLSYVCGTGTKLVTGTGGTFTCPKGTTIKFTVGGTTMCQTAAQAFITLVSCAQSTNANANASTPSVVAAAQFLMSINTTQTPSANSPTAITITPAEDTAAAGLSLDFSTVTQAALLAGVQTTTGNPSATLVAQAAAQAEVASTTVGGLVGSFSGTYSGGDSGTWTAMIAADGTVTGSGTNSKGKPFNIAGNLVTGTVFSGTAGSATWTGNLDTSKTPAVFSGTWNDPSSATSGTFTGTKK